MRGIGFGSRRSSWHGKLKVCDPKAPCDFRNPHLVPPPCTLLTSAFGDERARLTCWCSAARRLSLESSFGLSCLSWYNSARGSAPSAGRNSMGGALSTACSSGGGSRGGEPLGSGCCIRQRPNLLH